VSPIRAENRRRYPADWPAISRRIRERAGQRCEWCGAPNGKWIVRLRGTGLWAPGLRLGGADDVDDSFWLACYVGTWRDERGERVRVGDLPSDADDRATLTRVVLTVAHLNHTPEDCRDENLAALCQRCHLGYDMRTHVRNARETRERRRAAAQPSLFAEVTP
jgi:hypothetical protein